MKKNTFHLSNFSFLIGIIFSTVSCVTPIPFKEQLPVVNYINTNNVIVSVVDKRKRILSGKPKDFIGVAHSTFGIPVDWDVKTVIATEDDDDKKDLSSWLLHRITEGMNANGWKSRPIQIPDQANDETIKRIIENNNADMLIVFTLHEWYFSININWVNAFNFDTNTDVNIYSNIGNVFYKNFTERDVVDESASESPQNNVLRAYRDQIQQILNDSAIQLYINNIQHADI